MVDLKSVQDQLAKVGYKNKFWQKAEVKELCNVLHDDEKILQAANGYYEGGFSLLVATDHRLLLVDRKPMFLTLDSISYKMIQELSYNYRLLNSTLHIFTSNKCLDFSSWNHGQIRTILSFAQQAMKSNNQDTDTDPALPRQDYRPKDAMPSEQLDYVLETHDVPTMPTPQTNFVTSSSNTSHNLANLVLSSKNFREPQVADGPVLPNTSGTAQRQQYFRRYY